MGFNTNNGDKTKGWVTVNPCKDPKYKDERYVSVKNNSSEKTRDHSTYITTNGGAPLRKV